MAFFFGGKSVLSAWIFSLVFFIASSDGRVHELNSGSIRKFLEGKHLTLTFVDSHTCSRCRVLYTFFVIASQSFIHDSEIFFTRTHDKSLAQDWEVKELPAIVYRLRGEPKHEIMNIDITVDGIIDNIAMILYGNFEGLTRIYSLDVTQETYEELIVTPKQWVMLLIHNKTDTDERAAIEEMAYSFRSEEEILCARLDVTKYTKLRNDKFRTRTTPAAMWFKKDAKTPPSRFGGLLTAHLMIQFANERTGLKRELGGDLQEEAGLIDEADAIIDKNIDIIMEGTPGELKTLEGSMKDLKQRMDSSYHELLDQYIAMIKALNVAGKTHILHEMVSSLEYDILHSENISSKRLDFMRKYKNIIIHCRNLQEWYEEERKTKSRKEVRRLAQKKWEKTGESEIHHHHQHTEL